MSFNPAARSLFPDATHRAPRDAGLDHAPANDEPEMRYGQRTWIVLVDAGDIATVSRLRSILPDGALLPMPAGSRLPTGYYDVPYYTAPPLLTDRQKMILTLLQQGRTNKEIGRALSISHFTVRNQVSQLLRRFGVRTRGQLAAETKG